MTRSELTLKVRQRIDEVGTNETIALNFPIDAFLLEAANQTLADAPLSLANNIIDFKTAIITIGPDGSGSVKLPLNFIRLVEFKMQGWQRSVFEAHKPTEKIMLRQRFKSLRGGSVRPIAIINADTLTYYSLPTATAHVIEIAKAQVSISSLTDFPDLLTDATAWLTASKVLQVMNEQALANSSLQQYIQIISTLKS
ncbi:MAG: hypothetical protein RR141_04195 [Rikenellaceae bacterium]